MTTRKPRCRVLIVEDEAVISILIEDMLVDFGTEIVGPAARMTDAIGWPDKPTSISESSTSTLLERRHIQWPMDSRARHPVCICDGLQRERAS